MYLKFTDDKGNDHFLNSDCIVAIRTDYSYNKEANVVAVDTTDANTWEVADYSSDDDGQAEANELVRALAVLISVEMPEKFLGYLTIESVIEYVQEHGGEFEPDGEDIGGKFA